MNPFSTLWQNDLLPFAVWVLTGLARTFDHLGPLSAIGSFGLAVMLVTVMVRTILLPLAWLAKQRQGGWSGAGLGIFVAVAQYPIMVALYYAVRSVAVQSSGLNFHFLWVPDLTRSPYDVCCAVMQGGNLATDAGGTVVHSSLAGGLPSHPGAALLPVIAVVLSIFVGLRQIGPKQRMMSPQQLRKRAVSQQMTVIGTVPILLIGLVVAQAVALYWITQALFGVLQTKLLKRLARPRAASHRIAPQAAAA